MTDKPTLEDLGRRDREAKAVWDAARKILRERTQSEYAGGHGKSESQIAREAGVDRMTIRKWLGK